VDNQHNINNYGLPQGMINKKGYFYKRYYDGGGEEIKLTPSQYYEKFVYSEDFINLAEIGYNQVLSSGNMIENQFEVYDNAIANICSALYIAKL
jgi:hypothetical protein